MNAEPVAFSPENLETIAQQVIQDAEGPSGLLEADPASRPLPEGEAPEGEVTDWVDDALERISDALCTLRGTLDTLPDTLPESQSLAVLINVLDFEHGRILERLNELEITDQNRQTLVEELELEITTAKQETKTVQREISQAHRQVVTMQQSLQAQGLQMEVLDQTKQRFVFVDVDGSRKIIKVPKDVDIFDPSETSSFDDEEGGVFEKFGKGDYQLRADFATEIRAFLRSNKSTVSSKAPTDPKAEQNRFVAILRDAGIKWEVVADLYTRWFGEETTWQALETRVRRKKKGVVS